MWQYQRTDELYHYGVLGMKWGHRKDYKNKDQILSKNTKIRRISTSYEDPVYDNKKYISINDEDHKKWDKYLGEEYLNRGKMTYDIGYTTIKDIKIASAKTVGKEYTKMLLDTKFKNTVISDTKKANIQSNQKGTSSASINASRNIAYQTETGKKIVQNLLKNKYEGMYDSHGNNTSENPLIIFNPDKNLKRSNFDTYLSSPVYKYLKNAGHTDKEIENYIQEKEFRRMMVK